MSLKSRRAVERSEEHGAKRRAQGSIIDFLVGFIIFILVFFINFYTWNSIEIKLVNTEQKFYFDSSIHNAVESLITKSGEPINWEDNTSSVISLGLAIEDNVLSNEKLAALNTTDYSLLVESVLSTGDYQIRIKNDSTLVYITGITPPITTKIVTRVERLVRINDSYYQFIFKGWSPN